MRVSHACKNPFIKRVVDELGAFDRLDARCLEAREKKTALAKFFVERYHDCLVQRRVRMFLESGSTVAYVAEALGNSLSDENLYRVHMSTNNVLAFLQLWLVRRAPCVLFPPGAPEGTYGASYGALSADDIALPAPDYSQPPLDETARSEIRKLMEAPGAFGRGSEPALLLGATSGLQLGTEHRLRGGIDPETGRELPIPDEVRRQIAQCFGPHVGSYRNKLFKRSLYETQLPIVIFLTSAKIDCEIEVGRCHFILDRQFSWQRFYREYPLAFCVGSTVGVMDTHIETFTKLGFDVITGARYPIHTAFIARNRSFIAEFEEKVGFRSE
jgi:hypothetical protein